VESLKGRLAAIALSALILAAIGALTAGRVDLTYVLDAVRLERAAPPAPLAARFNDPSGLYVDPRGRVYFSIRRQHRIWAFDGGQLQRVAGTGRMGFSGEGRQAARARLKFPEGLAGDAAGNLYVADSENHRVRVIAPDGRIRTFAGTGLAGFSGDGGPAGRAQLFRPMDLACSADGALWIADWGNHRVRRVGPEGLITTVAGSGEPGYAGDGGPATAARLDQAYGIAVGPGGVLYIADSANHRVRRVGPEGIISTVAGTGETGYAGDGGPALGARFDSPQDLIALADGGLIVNDEHNHRLRQITPDGTVSLLAGNGRPDWCGDGGPAISACFNDPESIALGPDGALWITDGDNHRLRRIDPDGTLRTLAGGNEQAF